MFMIGFLYLERRSIQTKKHRVKTRDKLYTYETRKRA